MWWGPLTNQRCMEVIKGVHRGAQRSAEVCGEVCRGVQGGLLLYVLGYH